jgi:hypothetical protein
MESMNKIREILSPSNRLTTQAAEEE